VVVAAQEVFHCLVTPDLAVTVELMAEMPPVMARVVVVAAAGLTVAMAASVIFTLHIGMLTNGNLRSV